MKKIICAVIVAGALSQIANAMGPVGDTTHRHLYKDQEWIWQGQVDQPKPDPAKDPGNQASRTQIWRLPVAFLVPTGPTKPSLTFLVPTGPTKPSLTFLVPTGPTKPSLTFLVPTGPTKPSLTFLVPTKPSVAFLVPHKPTGV